MTDQQQQELKTLLSNLNNFDSNVEVQILISEINGALENNITLREYRKRKKQLKKKQHTV
jgi:hypothetical protein